MPEITMSGCSSLLNIALIPIFTQSPGVPVVTHALFTPWYASTLSFIKTIMTL